MQKFCGANDGFGRYASCIQAVAAHLVFFHQCNPGLDRGRDVGADQACGTGPDYDQVVIEARRLFIPAQGLARVNEGHRVFGGQRKQAQQRERDQQRR